MFLWLPPANPLPLSIQLNLLFFLFYLFFRLLCDLSLNELVLGHHLLELHVLLKFIFIDFYELLILLLIEISGVLQLLFLFWRLLFRSIVTNFFLVFLSLLVCMQVKDIYCLRWFFVGAVDFGDLETWEGHLTVLWHLLHAYVLSTQRLRWLRIWKLLFKRILLLLWCLRIGNSPYFERLTSRSIHLILRHCHRRLLLLLRRFLLPLCLVELRNIRNDLHRHARFNLVINASVIVRTSLLSVIRLEILEVVLRIIARKVISIITNNHKGAFLVDFAKFLGEDVNVELGLRLEVVVVFAYRYLLAITKQARSVFCRNLRILRY